MYAGGNDFGVCSGGSCKREADGAEVGTDMETITAVTEAFYQQGFKRIGWYRTGMWYETEVGNLSRDLRNRPVIDQSNNKVLIVLSVHWQSSNFPREGDYAHELTDMSNNFDVIKDIDLKRGKWGLTELNKYDVIYIKHPLESASYPGINYLDLINQSSAIVVTGGDTLPPEYWDY